VTSAVAWLDYDDEQRRRMRDVVHMFRDEGAVDELGIGRMRDAFSDRLFPGTSVLWNRARYLLFVPWVYMLLERGEDGAGSAEDRARRLQRRLAKELRASAGGGSGVIGASGADVKQTPDVILWAALEAWGVRRDRGGLGQVRELAAGRAGRNRIFEAEEQRHRGIWDPRVERMLPEGFPANASFALTDEEAAFLADSMIAEDALPGSPAARRADSLLTVLIREGSPTNVGVPWKHPMATASAGLRAAARHAGLFADLMAGARLLYAELVALSRGDQDELSAEIEVAFAGWSALRDERLVELRDWAEEPEDFWLTVREINPNISDREERFVRGWADVALADPATVRDSRAARRLILEREHQAKGARARLGIDGSIGRDAKAVLPRQFTFRWDQAKQIAADINQGH